jgi:hypothetical protein
VHNPKSTAKIGMALVGKIELPPDVTKMGVPVEIALVPDSGRDMVSEPTLFATQCIPVH